MSWFWLFLEPFRKRAPLQSLWNGLSKASTKPQTVARNLWRCVFCPTIWSWLSRVDRTICVISPWQIPKHSARNNSSDRKRNQGGLILISTVGGFSQVLYLDLSNSTLPMFISDAQLSDLIGTIMWSSFSRRAQRYPASCWLNIFAFPPSTPEGFRRQTQFLLQRQTQFLLPRPIPQQKFLNSISYFVFFLFIFRSFPTWTEG